MTYTMFGVGVATLSAVLLASSFGGALAASNDDIKKVVRDARGQVVRGIEYDNCVVTTWQASPRRDKCGNQTRVRNSRPSKHIQRVAEPQPVQQPIVLKAEPLILPVEPVAVAAPTIHTAEKSVYFDFDSAALNGQAIDTLDTLATLIPTRSDVEAINLIGHADRMGADSYNQQLSQKRAKAVKKYFEQRGVSSNVVDMQAMGEEFSASSCLEVTARDSLISCLENDRKVEVKVQFIRTLQE